MARLLVDSMYTAGWGGAVARTTSAPAQGLALAQGFAVAQGLPAQGLAVAQGLPAQGFTVAQGFPAQGLAVAQGVPAQGFTVAQGVPAQGLTVPAAPAQGAANTEFTVLGKVIAPTVRAEEARRAARY